MYYLLFLEYNVLFAHLPINRHYYPCFQMTGITHQLLRELGYKNAQKNPKMKLYQFRWPRAHWCHVHLHTGIWKAENSQRRGWKSVNVNPLRHHTMSAVAQSDTDTNTLSKSSLSTASLETQSNHFTPFQCTKVELSDKLSPKIAPLWQLPIKCKICKYTV